MFFQLEVEEKVNTIKIKNKIYINLKNKYDDRINYNIKTKL